ncbi:ATP-binding cassette domain-containing protein [Anaerocolumna sedimenticola]|uniref:ATP-binding cassette domain-containing protein n=1 Tax=Anaerocolumna sedimenticola TaxID=2696063 RepID=A0A6P1TP19_9FIRM|nr:ABC transporter ATP-binding protein [Anaerocolumna sedimenticola]QHQ62734.1 ATP-binding cassette domain-containing protein [Anaerocolumna sedimenticola]
MESIITINNVVKEYVMGEVKIRAADGISFDVTEGELVVVLGPSGAGKSTVLNILGGMDYPTSGEVLVKGKDISKFSKNEMTMYRRKHIGFVFQFYNLMPNLNVLENVEIAAQICDNPMDAVTVINQVGLGERMANFPAQLSGGEQQRVSIARAIAKNPTLLLCDEPTGALDYMTGKSILKLLRDVNQEFKKTVMIITHNSPIAQMADKVVKIKNGKVESVEINETPIPIERIEW